MAQINELEELIRAVDRLTQSEEKLAKVSGQISQLNDEIAVSEGEAREALIKKQDKLSDEQVLLNKKIKLQRQVVEEEKAAARAAGVSEKAIDRATSSTRKLNDESSLAARTLRQFGPVGRTLATALELSRKSAGGLAGALKGVKTALIGSGIGLAIVAISKAVGVLVDKIKDWWKENYSLEASQERVNKQMEVARKSLKTLTDERKRLADAQKELAEANMTDEELLAQRRKDAKAYSKEISDAQKELADTTRGFTENLDGSWSKIDENGRKITISAGIIAKIISKEADATENLNRVNSEAKRLEDSIARSKEKNTKTTKDNTKAIDEARIAYEKYAAAMRKDISSKAEEVTPKLDTGRGKTLSEMLQNTAYLEANTVKSTQQMIDDIKSEMDNAKISQFENEEQYNNFMIGKAEELTAAYKQQNQERIDNEERTQQEKIAIAQYGFDALNSVLDLAYADDEDKSRKAFERNKKLQYAQTLVNGASGSVAIWTDAKSGIKAKVAAQVALALSTAVALQQIARTRYDSGGTPDTGQTVGKSATELLSQSQTITSLQTQTQAAASQTVLVVSDVDYQQNFANSTRAKAVIS